NQGIIEDKKLIRIGERCGQSCYALAAEREIGGADFGDNSEPFNPAPPVPDFSINFRRLRELKKVQAGALAFVLEQRPHDLWIDLAVQPPMKITRPQIRGVFCREQPLRADYSQIGNLPDKVRQEKGGRRGTERHLPKPSHTQ